MTRSQSIAVMAMFGLGLAFAPAAWADHKSDACAALVDARNTLYSMLNAKDKSAHDVLNAKVAADFKAVWDQFKETREREIIPAIYTGNAGEAKKIADGIQSERIAKMWSIMSCKP